MTELTLISVLPGRRRPQNAAMAEATSHFLKRAAQYQPCTRQVVESEDALLRWAARQPGRAAAHTVLFDPRGRILDSAQFAALLGRLRDEGTQRIGLAVGPPNGWTLQMHNPARAQAATLVSLGPLTLPHELAALVAAEQIYRALTILAGHPYHSGH